MLAAGVQGFIHDDWQMNTHFGALHKYNGSRVSFASGCYCEHCMRGFTEHSAVVMRALISRADWSGST